MTRSNPKPQNRKSKQPKPLHNRTLLDNTQTTAKPKHAGTLNHRKPETTFLSFNHFKNPEAEPESPDSLCWRGPRNKFLSRSANQTQNPLGSSLGVWLICDVGFVVVPGSVVVNTVSCPITAESVVISNCHDALGHRMSGLTARVTSQSEQRESCVKQ